MADPLQRLDGAAREGARPCILTYSAQDMALRRARANSRVSMQVCGADMASAGPRAGFVQIPVALAGRLAIKPAPVSWGPQGTPKPKMPGCGGERQAAVAEPVDAQR